MTQAQMIVAVIAPRWATGAAAAAGASEVIEPTRIIHGGC
jgi:hypothetical protein